MLRSAPDDFEVDEALPYPLAGDGGHLFVRIEKRGVDSLNVVRRLAELAAVGSDDVGVAGLKDRWSVARQWLSVPDAPALEGRLSALEDGDVRILEVTRHPHKLRRGHVGANRFVIRLTAVPDHGLARARATLAALAARGVPNFFGRQRFGRDGDNAVQGLALLRGRRGRRTRLSTLLLSSVQSAVFNRALAVRLAEGALGTAWVGDLMQKHDTGGLFDVGDATAEKPRVDAVAISPTGPIVGKRMRAPSGRAAALEAAAVEACGLTGDDVLRLGRGSRRAMRVPLDPEALVTAPEQGVLRLSFSLPSGGYATTVLDELVKPAEGMFERLRPA